VPFFILTGFKPMILCRVQEQSQTLQVVTAVCLTGVTSMLTARSVAVNTAAIIAALAFLAEAQADLCMMMRTLAAGTGCYSVALAK
jgi:hypothetical protein